MSRADGIPIRITDIKGYTVESTLDLSGYTNWYIRLLYGTSVDDWEYIPFGNGYSAFLNPSKLASTLSYEGGVAIIRKLLSETSIIANGGNIGPFNMIGLWNYTGLFAVYNTLIFLNQDVTIEDGYIFRFTDIGNQIPQFA